MQESKQRLAASCKGTSASYVGYSLRYVYMDLTHGQNS